jgi:hypothetical protein
MKTQIFEFTGISPVKIKMFSLVRNSSKQTRDKWLAKALKMGRNFG